MTTESPLTSADHANIQKAVYNARLAQDEIAKLKACGFDCAEDELRCEHLIRTLEAIQTQWPPKAR